MIPMASSSNNKVFASSLKDDFNANRNHDLVLTSDFNIVDLDKMQ